MEQSLIHTLARKHKTTKSAMYAKYKSSMDTDYGPVRCIKVVVPRADKEPLMTYFGGIPLRRRKATYLVDDKRAISIFNERNQLIKRLLADTCELCGSTVRVNVHHIRKLKDLKKRGRGETPAWKIRMSAMRRKTLVVCHACHTAIHAGQSERIPKK